MIFKSINKDTESVYQRYQSTGKELPFSEPLGCIEYRSHSISRTILVFWNQKLNDTDADTGLVPEELNWDAWIISSIPVYITFYLDKKIKPICK